MNRFLFFFCFLFVSIYDWMRSSQLKTVGFLIYFDKFLLFFFLTVNKKETNNFYAPPCAEKHKNETLEEKTKRKKKQNVTIKYVAYQICWCLQIGWNATIVLERLEFVFASFPNLLPFNISCAHVFYLFFFLLFSITN